MINIQALKDIQFAPEDRNVIQANLPTPSGQQYDVTFTRKLEGWDVLFVVTVNDRVVHDAEITDVDKKTWYQLAQAANDTLDRQQKTLDNHRKQACNLLFIKTAPQQ